MTGKFASLRNINRGNKFKQNVHMLLNYKVNHERPYEKIDKLKKKLHSNFYNIKFSLCTIIIKY